MLQIKNITKTYKTGDLVQKALDGVSLNLRKSEFVAVLGPSGSGKTTLLNIIGGLDRYDSGDLIINGISTKDYKDRDWDAYRNHTIGFVFQSYNLIPHQTILSNVELALTIGGISAAERRSMALDALDAVGLKDQAHKKPNQMSGGQMQRVAIARALVNNPDIVLADEPTGALDTKTSIQVLDLLKEVAKDRLVVMVTHNPELADRYANRIVRLRDGKIVDDSNPYLTDENKEEALSGKRIGKARMGFFTALSLSFNNLLTKKGRTILTAFAGSIGIIGIALILSLSQGFQNYIDKIQEDTLSSYPLTITRESTDMTSMILGMSRDRQGEQSEGTLKERRYLTNMFASVSMNEIRPFKDYVESHYDEIKKDVTGISYTYAVSPIIYTYDATDKLVQINPNSVLTSFTSGNMSSLVTSAYSSYGFGIFTEMSDNMDMIRDNYDILAGRLPERYDELLIVLSERDGISDLLVYSLGLRNFEELTDMFTRHLSGEEVENNSAVMTFTYEDLLNLDLRLILATDRFKYNVKYNIYEDMSGDEEYMKKLYDNALKLKIVGIVVDKEGASTTFLSPGVNYTKDLTRYIIDSAADTSIVAKQLNNKNIDVFSGKSFEEMNKEQQESMNFEDMISIDQNKLAEAFTINADLGSMNDAQAMQDKIISKSKDIAKDLDDAETLVYQELVKQFSTAAKGIIESYATYLSFFIPDDSEGVACPLGYAVPGSVVSGCALPDESDPDYETEIAKYRKVKGVTTNPDIPTEIYVYEDRCVEYVMFNSMVTDAFKQAAITKDILQIDELVTVARSCFDEYVNEAKELVDTSSIIYSVLSLVRKDDLDTINTDDVVARGMATTESQSAIRNLATSSTEEYTYLLIAKGIGEVTADLLSPLSKGDLMKIDSNKFAQAFKFNMSEDELQRIMSAMMSDNKIASAATNLTSLGYQDIEEPTTISFFFSSFEGKENFLDWLDAYNERVSEEEQINYTDITGILMSSVKTIVDSVTYVLIAFVSISLIVSSIMIAVITLISVMERTKEIGILRAMGASKRNISSIFNAETFIIGLLSGLLGIGTTILLIPLINRIIHNLTGNYNINAVLPAKYAGVLVVISVFLTMIAGFIPSKKAARQDPVIALRTE